MKVSLMQWCLTKIDGMLSEMQRGTQRFAAAEKGREEKLTWERKMHEKQKCVGREEYHKRNRGG